MSSLFFIDSRVGNQSSLLQSLPANSRVITLNAAQDGLQQIATALVGQQNLDALHIISHGAAGTLYLGSSVINQENLFNYNELLSSIGSSLNSTGDILLYGCNVAEGETGAAFIAQLAQATGADVAASTDLTGANGDWQLEAQQGAIETSTVDAQPYQLSLGVTNGFIVDINGTESTDWWLNGTDDPNRIFGLGGNDYLYGNAGNDTLSGGTGNDHLEGGDDDDLLQGDAGDDDMYGKAGNDTLAGGGGNDQLTGDTGTDVYRFALGAGQDKINAYDYGSSDVDRIEFDASITPNMVNFNRKVGTDDLVLTINNSTDTLTVQNYFSNSAETQGYSRVTFNFSNGTQWSADDISNKVVSMEGTSASDWMYGTSNPNAIRGNNGNDYLYGYDGNDTLEGGDGTDQLESGDGADTLRGDGGNDRLSGNSGDDTLIGGSGNDVMEGNAGTDVYIFEAGAGQDQINAYDYNSSDIDIVQLGATFTTANVRFARALASDDLVISFTDSTDTLLIDNYFGWNPDLDGYNRIQLNFADGTRWGVSDILTQVVNLEGSSSSNYLYGTANPNLIRGNAGNDYLYGYAGSDSLEGGDGGDQLEGGGDNDQLKGDAGNDHLYGNDGDDTLDGGADNDVLEGNAGADTYLFNVGSGRDQIITYDYNTSDVDTVLFGADILANTVRLARSLSGDDLVVTFNGNANDSVTIDNYFSYAPDVNGYSRVNFQFSNGNTWNAEDILQKVVSMEGTTSSDYLYGTPNPNVIRGNTGSDYLYGYAQSDTLEGGDGNDQLEGGDDNDTLNGDAGNDRLYGNTGDDTLNGGAGDDYLEGSSGVDSYRFNIGSGRDQINNYDYNSSDTDYVLLGAGITSEKLSFARTAGTDDLVMSVSGTTDSLTLKSYFTYSADTQGYSRLILKFNNGTDWGSEALATQVVNMNGSSSNDYLYGTQNPDSVLGNSGNDYLYGYDGNDTLDGGDGSDYIEGNDGSDLMRGGAGNDRIYGKDGNDTLDGGAGSDQLEGQTGTDTYYFNLGSGQDEINAYDYNSSDVDVVMMGTGITTSALRMSRVVNTDDLLISLSNSTTDTLKIKNYFTYEAYSQGYSRVELRFTDGSSWSNGTFTIANPNNAPTGTLTISGQAAQGQTLTAVSSIADADGLGTINYQWLANGSVISGATDATFTLGLEQVGKTISVKASYTDGLNNAESVLSSATSAVAAVNNSPTGRLSISGTPNPEQTLTAVSTIADADGLGTLTYQWFADSTAISGATESTFTLTSAQLGKAISVRASYTDGLGNAEVVRSTATGAVTVAQEAGVTFSNITGLSSSEAGGTAAFQVALSAEPRHDVTLTFSINDATEGKFQASGNATTTVTFTASNWNTPQTVTLVGVDDSLNDGDMAYVISTRVASDDLRYDGMRSGSGLSIPSVTASNTDDDSPDEWYGDAGGSAIADYHTGGNGDSDLYGLNSRDELYGGNGNDRLYGGNGDDVLHGEADNDEVEGDQGNDKLYGEIGNDTLTGGTGKDSLYGGDGNDVLDGSSDQDFMDGGNGADTYYVDNAADVVRDSGTDSGKDVLYITAYLQGGYVLGAGLDNAVLAALANNASLTGNAGKNVLTGNGSNNQLKGGAGVDTLSGGAGNDTLVGGAGKDVLNGGAGKDVFKLEKLVESGTTVDTRDIIQSFTSGQDKVSLATLDANTQQTGDQSFTDFISGTDTFDAAGQLQFKNGILYGNTDGDSAAEFSIALTGVNSLALSDIIA